METIFQSIEILSKEKGIDPQIVLDAVKDAMLIAARKHYRSNEDYVADMDPKTGAISLYAVKKAVEAGREAYLAGRMPKKPYVAAPSSPASGLIAPAQNKAA